MARILLLMGRYDSRLHAGVARYARLHNWILNDDMCYEHVAPETFCADGIISYHGGNTELIGQIGASKLPAVDMDYPIPGVTWPQVLCNDWHTGQIAAKRFIELNFKHAAFVAAEYTPRETYKRDGFAETLQSAGIDYHDLHLSTLENTLPSCGMPIALMTVSDRVAVEVLYKCSCLKLDIPEDVSIIGCGNDPFKYDVRNVSISSIDEESEHRAFRAAGLLDAIIKGEKTGNDTTIFEPGELIERNSTGIVGIRHPKVRMAMQILDRRASPHPNPEALAARVGISRRRLDALFIGHLGRTIADELELIQLSKAKKMLTDTRLQISFIAQEAGFSSPHHMIAAFKRQIGMTPRDFRQQHYRVYKKEYEN